MKSISISLGIFLGLLLSGPSHSSVKTATVSQPFSLVKVTYLDLGGHGRTSPATDETEAWLSYLCGPDGGFGAHRLFVLHVRNPYSIFDSIRVSQFVSVPTEVSKEFIDKINKELPLTYKAVQATQMKASIVDSRLRVRIHFHSLFESVDVPIDSISVWDLVDPESTESLRSPYGCETPKLLKRILHSFKMNPNLQRHLKSMNGNWFLGHSIQAVNAGYSNAYMPLRFSEVKKNCD